MDIVRKATNSLKPEDSVERILDLFAQTRTNREFVEVAKNGVCSEFTGKQMALRKIRKNPGQNL